MPQIKVSHSKKNFAFFLKISPFLLFKDRSNYAISFFIIKGLQVYFWLQSFNTTVLISINLAMFSEDIIIFFCNLSNYIHKFLSSMIANFSVHMYMYYIHYYKYQLLDLVGRVFTNDQGDMGSIPGYIIQKTLKLVLDVSWLNTQ